MGFWPLAFVLLRAYSMGGGTYTGIEAVSNGVTMLREPRVKTGKHTMFLMAVSLAFTAGRHSVRLSPRRRARRRRGRR